MPNDKRSNISLKRKRSWVWAGVLLSLSTWMFFLGVLVGRGTAPIKFDIDKLEQTLLMKRKAADQKEMETISGNLDSGPDKTKLDFYEDLKKNQPEESVPEKPSEKETRKSPDPTPVKTKKAKSKSVSGLYTVQVASLRSKDSANRIANGLIKKGYDAFIATSSYGSGTWYRVRVGNFKQKSDAAKIARKVRNESYKPIVVRQR
jgi:cell division protein FtsN